jgi:hypothetical protein
MVWLTGTVMGTRRTALSAAWSCSYTCEPLYVRVYTVDEALQGREASGEAGYSTKSIGTHRAGAETLTAPAHVVPLICRPVSAADATKVMLVTLGKAG